MDAESSNAAPGAAPSAEVAPAPLLAVTKGEVRKRERFIPITTFALIDRLTVASSWPPGQARLARRLFQYLEFWRRQQHAASLSELMQTYEPFSPDSDLLVTRRFTSDERAIMQSRVIEDVERILEQANYERIDPADVTMILTRESHYGLDLHVDFTAFDEVLIYYRGATTRRDSKRSIRRFFRKEEFDVPIFQRLMLLFKLKPFDIRVQEVMEEKKVKRSEAEKIVKRARSMLPPDVREDNIYLKLFKNIPRSDIEMVFPNTRVKFRLWDKLRLGVTAGGGLGVGILGAAGKLAVAATNPIAAAGAVMGLGGVAVRQVFSFMNQKQKYMVVMAQNLYFHSLADNRGVLLTLADRASEEDVKEEILLYSVLAKEQATVNDLEAIDAAIEQYLTTSFDVTVDFDISDALSRLLEDGLVRQEPDGRLVTLPPDEAAQHLDAKWDVFLDHLPALIGEGEEFEGAPEPAQGDSTATLPTNSFVTDPI